VQDAGFIFASYIITFAAIVLFAVGTLRRAKSSAKVVEDQHKPWI